MSGALLLGAISLVCVADLMVAFYFLRLAGQAESDVGAAPKAGSIDPAAARRLARIMFVATPILWLVIALLAFGILPAGGIVPIGMGGH